MGYDIYWNSDVQITPPLSEQYLAELKYILLDEDPCTQDVFTEVSFSPEVESMHRHFHGSDLKDRLTWELDVASDSLPDLQYDTRWYADDAVAALKYLIQEFFKPGGYTLEGDLNWSGDACEDRGVLYIEGDKVEAVEDVIDNPGPSWKRERAKQAELSAAQRAVIRQVLRFALDCPAEFAGWLTSERAGNEPDLSVLSAEAISEMAYRLLNDHFS
jgi:hypothetical protein